VVPQGQGLARALEIAERIAKQAPIAVRATRANSWLYATQGQEAAIAGMPGEMHAARRRRAFILLPVSPPPCYLHTMSDTPHRMHHDMGGQAAGPVSSSSHEIEPWEKRIEAILR